MQRRFGVWFRWALLAILCGAPVRLWAQTRMPVFLDSLQMIHMALPEPARLDALRGQLTLEAASGRIAVSDVQPGGRPIRDRLVPRTPGRVVLAGTFQAALGGMEWDPDGEVTQMTETRPGVFDLTVTLPRGHYEYKVARNGSWAENYGAGFAPGGTNIALDVPKDGTVVRFVVDFNARTIEDSVHNPSDVPAPAIAPARVAAPAGAEKYDVALLRLTRPIRPEDVSAPMALVAAGGERRTVIARDVLSDPAFQYAGDDLGARWTKAATTFKVWSPVSSSAELLLFSSASGGTPRVLPMERGAASVWSAKVPGDLHGTFYRYRFHSYGETREAADIYSVAASADASRSMVVDLERTDPPDWPGPRLPRRRSATDAVLYEISVRDFSALPGSGVQPAWRGKYLALSEKWTSPSGAPSPNGPEHLLDLGVTDIHLLPIQSSVTLNAGGGYGWGYATTLFNVPEESYSTTPDDPVNVIREAKRMVAGLHRLGLRMVMDVVYNHTWPPEGKDSAFAQTVPYYYVRTNDRGAMLNESGVGNAMADERPMVRKFIRESLLYWLREYNVDGFRFDLLGMHNPESVADWAKALRRVRPDVLVYGEPWTGGGPLRFGKGAQQGLGVAVFNDTFRGAIRGDTDASGPGFAMGADVSPDLLRLVLSGSLHASPGDGGFTTTPAESVNYVSAHDNLTLWDKVRRAMPGAGREEQARAVKLANAAVLLAEGIPFLEGGAEIGRTKGGNPNTYNADDVVNGFHWEDAAAYRDVSDYVRGLITLRRTFPALRLDDAAAIRKDMHFLDQARLPRQTIAWTLPAAENGWREMLVILHGARSASDMALPPGSWKVLADGDRAGLTERQTVAGTLPLTPLSAYVLVR